MTKAAAPVRSRAWWDWMGSIEFTLIALGLAMILVFFGTLGQVSMGTFGAQKLYFNSWWLYVHLGEWRLPVFPGGLSLGVLWAVNLIAAFLLRFEPRWRDAGIWMSHAGLLLLLLGQGLTQLLAQESQMALPVGSIRNYSEASDKVELVLLRSLDDVKDRVVAVPESLFRQRGIFAVPGEPVRVKIRRYLPNAMMGMAQNASGLATQGIGTRIAVQPAPLQTSQDAQNTPALFVEIFDGETSQGTWLVSTALGAPQSAHAGGYEYRLALRPKRVYYPFSVGLKEFRHDVYPGTDIPKNFASLVHLSHPEKSESRDALIYMNHPLRYEGSTFYQASFGQGDQLSVLQVVQNPVWLTPYLSCGLVLLGLAIQFGMRLRRFTRRTDE